MAVLPKIAQHVRRDMSNRKESHNGVMLATTLPLFVLMVFFYAARIYSRINPAFRLHWDDLVITLAFV
jgi:hypothetical protein